MQRRGSNRPVKENKELRQQNIEPITKEEVTNIIRKLKKVKAVGYDNIIADCLLSLIAWSLGKFL